MVNHPNRSHLLHTYVVRMYAPDTVTRERDRDPTSDGYMWKTAEVEALTAAAALYALGYAQPATHVEQNHPDEAVRDNAHVQRDGAGRIGAQAIRKDGLEAFEAAYAARKARAAEFMGHAPV